MIDVFSDVIQFRGTHYDFGFKQGELLRGTPLMKNREKVIKRRRKRHYQINVDDFRAIMMTFSPPLWEEINGLADALNLSLQAAIEQFGGYYLEYQPSGCSVFSRQDYLVRNYDFHPRTYDGRFLLYHPSDQGYASIGPSMQVTGRTDGMNEHGLVIGYNFVNRRDAADGFVCNMISRIVLETCRTVEEAIALLKAIPHRSTFNYVLLDQAGIMQVVEATPTDIQVRQASICTNHFEILTEKNRYHLDNSQERQQIMQQKEAQITDDRAAYQLMNQREGNVYGTDYANSNGTIHTAIYYPQTGRVGIAIGANKQPLMFNLTDWLAGERSYITQIRGQLDTVYPFANMTRRLET